MERVRNGHKLGPYHWGVQDPCVAYPQGGAVAAMVSKQVSCKWQTLVNVQLIIDIHVPSF